MRDRCPYYHPVSEVFRHLVPGYCLATIEGVHVPSVAEARVCDQDFMRCPYYLQAIPPAATSRPGSSSIRNSQTHQSS